MTGNSNGGRASGRAHPPRREQLQPLATAGVRSGHPFEALWLARTLWNHWPPRKPPRPVVLVRRPDATDEQWNSVRAKLEKAGRRLALCGVPVRVEWDAHAARVVVDGDDGQLDLFGGTA
jgi:hypothetical protein